MVLRFVCPLIVVDDVAASRRFYEDVLGQTVKFDFGENVTFEGDFAIHHKAHYQSLLGDEKRFAIASRAHNAELYFETGAVEALDRRVAEAGLEFVHALREQPWGQRVVRFYDPDGHIVEVGETMTAVVRRFHEAGMSVDEIAQRTSMPRELVQSVLEDPSSDG
jgi:catechol 2,3-dioxygenase-like lactoylglutathione lyase family enzyme